MHKITIDISDDWRSVSTRSDGTLSEEQTLMALERAATYYRSRVAALHWHKVTAEMAEQAALQQKLRNGGIITP